VPPIICPLTVLHELPGGAYERPENTIMAFQHALDVGSDLLELDCFLTADGMARALLFAMRTCMLRVFMSKSHSFLTPRTALWLFHPSPLVSGQVVVVHDEHLGRLCAGAASASTSVRALPFAELPRVQPQPLLPPPFHPAGMRLAPYWPVGADEVANDDGRSDWRRITLCSACLCGFRFSCRTVMPDCCCSRSHDSSTLQLRIRTRAGTFTAPADLAAGQPMPLLDDVFRAFPHATINVDCKTPDEELVTKVCAHLAGALSDGWSLVSTAWRRRVSIALFFVEIQIHS
jgi:glycerophosphoryl diester phosphodiesterase